MLSILQVSKYRFVIVRTNLDCSGNLQIYSKGKLGDKNEMIAMPQSKTITKPLSYYDVAYLFCLLSKEAELSEQDWENIL